MSTEELSTLRVLLGDLARDLREVKTALLGGLDGDLGLIARMAAAEAEIRMLKAAQNQGGRMTWDVIKIALGGLAGAITGLFAGGHRP